MQSNSGHINSIHAEYIGNQPTNCCLLYLIEALYFSRSMSIYFSQDKMEFVLIMSK